MIVNTDQIRMGVKKYVEYELAQKSSGVTKFMIYFFMPSIDKKVTSYINNAQSNELFLDMFDENKCV